ncbi:MAG: dTDP-4-dehydrorhamnose reductase [Vicinamibacterales bacterium]
MRLTPDTTVLVTGAAGQLAGACADRLAGTCRVVALDRRALDIAAPAEVRRVVAAIRPAVILNCAAYNDVDGAESHAEAALAANGLAVGALAAAARDHAALLVHYSTDFVFDPPADAGLLTETDPVRPRGVYAQSKLLGEIYAREAPRHYVLRVASLFGASNGRSSVDKLALTLRRGERVRAFADRTVTPSYVYDVADATVAMIERDVAPGLYHCVNTGATTWVTIARELARLLGVDADQAVEPTPFASLVAPAPRPQYPALSNARLAAAGIVMPPWSDALQRAVAKMAAGS